MSCKDIICWKPNIYVLLLMYKVDINLKVKESFLFIQTFFSLRGRVLQAPDLFVFVKLSILIEVY